MHRASRSKTLTNTVGAKHNDADFKAIQGAAKAAGLTVSEWARQIHLTALSGAPDTRLILSELLAFRRVFLALEVDLVEGKELTQDRLRAAMDEADRTKFEMADKRIAAFRERAQKPKSQLNGEVVQ